MAKAKLLGMQRKYIPNNRADILARKNTSWMRRRKDNLRAVENIHGRKEKL